MRTFLVVTALLAGCGEHMSTDGADLSSPVDLAVVEDFATAGDDLVTAHDLALPPADLTTPPDMTDPMITGCTLQGVVPDELRCTGLYDNWATRHVADTAMPFTPAFELWSDGAKKQRWIQLPAGQKIDVADLDNWQFPLGTKLWKQFTVNVGGVDKIVETRLLWRVDTTGTVTSDWVHTTYQWSADQTSTSRVTNGVFPVAGTVSATAITGSTTTPYAGYEIPSEQKCVDCHSGNKGFVLGLGAVLASQAESMGVTYASLQAASLLKDTSASGNELLPASNFAIPGATVERKALGKLHANCGVCCHNPHIATASTDQRLRLNVDPTSKKTPLTVLATDAATTTINVAADAGVYPNTGKTWYRLHPTDVSQSAIPYRDGQRENSAQMPPVCTHANSSDVATIVGDWINYMTTGNGYPAPLP